MADRIKGFGAKFEELLEKNQGNRSFLNGLKNLIVKSKQYELAADVRQIEIDNFPEADSKHPDKLLAHKVSKALGMVGLNADERVCFKFIKVIEGIKEKDGEFSIMDSAKILADYDKFYGEDE